MLLNRNLNHSVQSLWQDYLDFSKASFILQPTSMYFPVCVFYEEHYLFIHYTNQEIVFK